MCANQHPGQSIPAVWCSKNGKKNHYWNPERKTFRSTLTLVPTGNRIHTRLAKKVAKFMVLERNDYGTKVIGYLVHSRTAARIQLEARERQSKADEQRERREARALHREREQNEAEQLAAIAEVGILCALFTINRAAKRYRDKAIKAWNQNRKEEAGNAADLKRTMYYLKGQALEWLLRDGTLAVAGYHRFADGNCAEILSGHGYSFHRPAELPDNQNAEIIPMIESKPPSTKEVDEWLAQQAVRGYLLGKATVAVYQWPVREREEAAKWYDDDDEEDQDWRS